MTPDIRHWLGSDERCLPIRVLRNARRTLLHHSRGKWAFIKSLPTGAKVLDVGCGDDSPRDTKAIRPDIHYIGIDIRDNNHAEPPQNYADTFHLVSPDSFPDTVKMYEGSVDAVISSHNLEHCYKPGRVLFAMADALKPGGSMYLAFPAEASVNLPHRKGTLNFYDAPDHIHLPRFNAVRIALAGHGMHIEFSSRRYRPLLHAMLGLIKEPYSALAGVVCNGTRALYGMETVIWARKC